MKIIRYADLNVLRWKNGAGLRREIAHGSMPLQDGGANEALRHGTAYDRLADSPSTHATAAGASNGHAPIAWSLGIAELLENAPFSSYPGVSRWFMPLGLGQLSLVFEDAASEGTGSDQARRVVTLNGRSEALHFSGADRVRVELHDGPMRALNVMTGNEGEAPVRPGTPGRHPEVCVKRLHFTAPGALRLLSNGVTRVSHAVLVEGLCEMEASEGSHSLAAFDCVSNDSANDLSLMLRPLGACDIVLVELHCPGS